MRYKPAGIGGDQLAIFTDSDSRRFSGNNPGTQYRIVAINTWNWRQLLVDHSLATVAALHLMHLAVAMYGYILSLAGKQWLGDIVIPEWSGLKTGPQKVVMPFKQLPQDSQQPFIGKQHLPGRLNQPHPGCSQLTAKVFINQPLPRIQLEHGINRLIFKIHKAPAYLFKTDIVHKQLRCAKTCLNRGITKIFNITKVLGGIGHTREMKGRNNAHTFPCLNQPLMDRVKLVSIRKNIFHPEPLDYTGFKQ